MANISKEELDRRLKDHGETVLVELEQLFEKLTSKSDWITEAEFHRELHDNYKVLHGAIEGKHRELRVAIDQKEKDLNSLLEQKIDRRFHPEFKDLGEEVEAKILKRWKTTLAVLTPFIVIPLSVAGYFGMKINKEDVKTSVVELIKADIKEETEKQTDTVREHLYTIGYNVKELSEKLIIADELLKNLKQTEDKFKKINQNLNVRWEKLNGRMRDTEKRISSFPDKLAQLAAKEIFVTDTKVGDNIESLVLTGGYFGKAGGATVQVTAYPGATKSMPPIASEKTNIKADTWTNTEIRLNLSSDDKIQNFVKSMKSEHPEVSFGVTYRLVNSEKKIYDKFPKSQK